MTPPLPTAPTSRPSTRLRSFAGNAVWSVLGVIVSLAAGLLLSPFIIRKLGAEGYGVWSLAFSLTGYYSFLDFGVRSAIINYTARESAHGNHEKINEFLSTAVAFTAAVTVLLLCIIAFLTPRTPRWFGIASDFRGGFQLLFVIVSVTVALSFCFNIVSGCLEGFQKYGALRRLQTVVFAFRTLGYFLVLSWGGGLIWMALCTATGAAALWVGYSLLLRSVFPQLHLRWSLVRISVLREMARYGFHTNVNAGGTLLLEQTPPVLIARSFPESAVGYFALPQRIVQTPLQMVRTVAEMLNPLTAEYLALKERAKLVRVGILGNRYSFVLYAPFALFILTWGSDLVRLWVGSDFGAQVAPMLPYFVFGSWVALAGQSATIGILFGLGEHRWCAWGMVAEALVVSTATALLLDRGLAVLSMWCAAGMLANRGLLSAWALCHSFRISFGSYLWSVYGRASLLAIPTYVLLAYLQRTFPLKNWRLILFAAVVATCVYMLPAYFLCFEKAHRAAVAYWLRRLIQMPRQFPAR